MLLAPRRIEVAPTRTTARPLAVAAGAGAALALAGGVAQSPLLLAAGVAVLGAVALAAAIVEPVLLILAFVAVRPLLDLGPTYGRGIDLNAPAGMVVLLAVASYAVRSIDTLVRPSRAGIAALLFGVAAGLSTLGAPTFGTSVSAATRVITVVALFLFAQQVARTDARFGAWLLGAALVATVFATAIAIAQIVDWMPLPAEYRTVGSTLLDAQLNRPPGPFPAPTVMGTQLCIGIAVCVIAIPRAWRSRYGRGAAIALTALAMVFGWVLLENRSRGAAIGTVIVLAGALGSRWRAAGLAAVAALLLLGAATLDARTVRLDEVGTQSVQGVQTDTLAWRVGYWERNLPRVLDSPVTGIGLGTVEQRNTEQLPPHSTAVQSLVEMGIAGALAYAGLVVCLGVELFGRARDERRRRAPGFDLTVTVAALCVAYLWMGLFENLLTQVVTSGVVAMLAGVALRRDEAPA